MSQETAVRWQVWPKDRSNLCYLLAVGHGRHDCMTSHLPSVRDQTRGASARLKNLDVIVFFLVPDFMWPLD